MYCVSAYPCRVLVGLESQVKHLAGFVALLVDKFIADSQQAGEAGVDNAVKVLSVVTGARLEAECTADSQQALQAGEDGGGAVGVEKLRGEAHKVGPSGGEIGLENALDDGDELLADEGIGVGEQRDEAVSNTTLFLLGYQFAGGDRFGRVP